MVVFLSNLQSHANRKIIFQLEADSKIFVLLLSENDAVPSKLTVDHPKFG